MTCESPCELQLVNACVEVAPPFVYGTALELVRPLGPRSSEGVKPYFMRQDESKDVRALDYMHMKENFFTTTTCGARVGVRVQCD